MAHRACVLTVMASQGSLLTSHTGEMGVVLSGLCDFSWLVADGRRDGCFHRDVARLQARDLAMMLRRIKHCL